MAVGNASEPGLIGEEKMAWMLKQALAELDLRDKEQAELQRMIAELEAKHFFRATCLELAASRIESLGRAIAERDEALEAMATSESSLVLDRLPSGEFAIFDTSYGDGKPIGRGPTPLVAIQNATKGEEGGGA